MTLRDLYDLDSMLDHISKEVHIEALAHIHLYIIYIHECIYINNAHYFLIKYPVIYCLKSR